MRKLPTAALNELRSLAKLWLKGFELIVLPSFALRSASLLDLSMISCGVSAIDANAFEGTKSLTTLNLNSNNQLKSIPTGALSKLSNLRKLLLVQTGQRSIPDDAFRGLNALQDIDLSHNEISSISSTAFKSVRNSLQVLLLHINWLAGGEELLPIATLTNLHQLNLAYNQIKSLPAGLFRNMGNLAFLNLQKNQLSSLNKATFSGIEHTISTLLLGNNGLQSIEANTFLYYSKLRELHLDGMPLKSVLFPEVFRGLEETLQTIHLDGCSLDDSVWSAVERLGKLTKLGLENNQLTQVPIDALQRMKNLMTLNLGENKIASLSQRGLHGPERSLMKLYLHDNLLQKLGRCSVFGFNKLRELTLKGNALQCDCELKWLKDWVADRYDDFLADSLPWRCSSPPKHAGKLFAKIKDSEFTCEPPAPTESVCEDIVAPSVIPVTTTMETLTISNLKMKITKQGITTLHIEWVIPDSILATLTGFIVEYRKAKGTGLHRSAPIHSSVHEYTIENLNSSTSYLVCLVLLKLDGSQTTHGDYCTSGNTTVGEVTGKQERQETDNSNVGVILGALIGVLVVVACVGVAAYIIVKQKRKASEKDKAGSQQAFPSPAERPQFGYGSKRFTKSKSRTSVDMAEDSLAGSATGIDNMHHMNALTPNPVGATVSGFTAEERDKILNMLTNSGSSPRYVPELPPRNLPPKKRKAQDDNPDDHVYQEINYQEMNYI